MADFDLSANLTIQNINITQKTLNDELRRLKGKGIIGLTPKINVTDIRKALKELGSFDADINIKPNITQTALKEAIKGKDYKVSVNLEIGNREALQKAFKKIFSFNNISGLKATVEEFANRVQKSKEVKVDTSKATKDVKILNNLIARLEETIGEARVGGFFEKSFDVLITKLRQAESSSEKFLSQFSGKDGNTFQNFDSALKGLVQQLIELDIQRDRLSRQGLLNPEIENQIARTRQQLIDFFGTLESAEPSTLSKEFKRVTDPLRQDLSELTKNTESFTREIDKLENEMAQLNAVGQGTSALYKNLNDQVSRLSIARFEGLSFSDTTSSDAFAELTSQAKELRSVNSEIDKIKNRAKGLEIKINSDANKTLAAQILGTPDQIAKIINDLESGASKLADRGGSKSELSGLTANATNQIREAENKAKGLDDILQKLGIEFRKLDSQGLNQASTEVQQLRTEVIALAKGGASLGELRQLFNTGLVDVGQIAETEKRLDKFLSVVDRLRINLGGGIAEDISGVGKAIAELQERVSASVSAGDSDREVRAILSAGNLRIRQLDRLNNAADKSAEKLRELAQVQATDAQALVFTKAADNFERYAQKIIERGGDVQKSLRNINRLFITVRNAASVEAGGGFLDRIAKLAGLAGSRLASFLISARGIFAFQNAVLEGASAAVTFDANLAKLEQVISKTSGSTQELTKRVDSLSRTVLSLGSNFGVAVGEITAATRVLTQAGIAGENLETAISAITKAQLGPTFDNINQTAEASIAILNQFDLTTQDLDSTLGGINAVASQFAVESEGIAKAVRKAGGAFKSAQGNFDEFVGLFTILKSETREADEALATGLRNISIRVQRLSIQENISEALFGGGNVFQRNGEFVGIVEALKIIKERFDELGVSAANPLFAQVVEDLAGARQFSRLLPIINNFGDLVDIQAKFTDGAKSLDEDASIALETVENKIQRLKNSFTELFSTVIRSDFVKGLLNIANSAAKALTTVVKAIDNINLALVVTTGLLGNQLLRRLDFFKLGLGVNSRSGAGNLLAGGFNRGGAIPGRGPNRDSVLAALTPGEYVLKRSAVDAIGVDRLNYINDNAKYFANKGGIIGRNKGGVIPGYNGGAYVDRISRANRVFGKTETVSQKTFLKFFNKEVKTSTKLVKNLSFSFGGLSSIVKSLNTPLVKFGAVLASAILASNASSKAAKDSTISLNQLALAALSAGLSVSVFKKLSGQVGKFSKELSTGFKLSRGGGSVLASKDAFLGGGGPQNLIQKAGAKLGGARFAPQLAKAGSALGKLGPIGVKLGIGLIALKAVVGSLTSSAIKNAEERLKATKVQSEINEELGKIESSESINRSFDLLGKIGNALSNTFGFLGSVVSELADDFKRGVEGVGKLLTDFVPGVAAVGQALSDFGSALINNPVGDFIADLFAEGGDSEAANRKIKQQNLARRGQEGARGASERFEEASSTEQRSEEFNKLVQNALTAIRNQALADGVSFGEALQNNKDLQGSVDTVVESVRKGLETGSIESVDDLIGQSDEQKQNFKELSNIFTKINKSFDFKQIERVRVAIDELSVKFESLRSFTKKFGEAIDIFDINIDRFSQRASAAFGTGFETSVPTKTFDLLNSGARLDRSGRNDVNRLIGNNRQLANAVNFEVGIKRFSRQINDRIVQQGTRLQINAREEPADALTEAILKQAEGLNFGPDVEKAFKQFVIKDAKDLAQKLGIDDTTKTISTSAITEVIKQFGEQGVGAVEALRQRAELESKFNNELSSLISRRSELEQGLIGQVNQVIDIQSQRVQFRNEVQTGRGDLSVVQARRIDQARRANQLRGTGVSSQAGVEQLVRQLIASQARQQVLGNTGDSLGAQRESIRGEKIRSVIESIASGTDTLTATVNNYRQAIEESQRSNEFFRNTLLGTDEQLINASKGITAFNRIVNSGNAFNAQQILSRLNESTRAGLQSFIGSSEERQRQFDAAIGLSSPAVRGAGAVDQQQAVQQKAAEGLALASQQLIGSTDKFTEELRNQKEVAISSLNAVNLAAQNLQKAVQGIPNQIEHNHNIPDINVNIVGAAGVERLQGVFQQLVQEQIRSTIAGSLKNLQRVNPNLNIPAQ